MDKNELKQIVIKEVDKLKEDITELGDDIYKHPETGYREFCTTGLLADRLEAYWGLRCRRILRIQAVKLQQKKRKMGQPLQF